MCFSGFQVIGDLAENPGVARWLHPGIVVAVAALGAANRVVGQGYFQGVSQVLDGGGAIAPASLPI
ncbi:hypothetical protein D3C80_1164100 [compost metagenome]